MENKDVKITGAENTSDPIPGETHEEKHENVIQHLIHEIKEDVKDFFDMDTFLHSDSSISGGITGVTDSEEEDEQKEEQ